MQTLTESLTISPKLARVLNSIIPSNAGGLPILFDPLGFSVAFRGCWLRVETYAWMNGFGYIDRLLKGGDILSIDGDNVTLTRGGITQKMERPEWVQPFDLPIVSANPVATFPTDLVAPIAVAADADRLEVDYNLVHFSTSGAIWATDGMRMHTAETSALEETHDIGLYASVPKKLALTLAAYAPGQWLMYAGYGVEGWTLEGPGMALTVPNGVASRDITRLLDPISSPRLFWSLSGEQAKALSKQIRAAYSALGSKQAKQSAMVHIDEGSLSFTSEGATLASWDISAESPDSTHVDPIFFADLLDATASDWIQIAQADPNRLIHAHGRRVDARLMPIRVK
jgi:hypothetical protein